MTAPAPPITVQATATPVVMSEGTKALLIFGFAFAADHFMRSESTKAAVMAVSGALLTAFWGIWHRLRTYFALRFLANKADDKDAIVGKAVS